MRAIEARSERAGVPTDRLMEQAGLAVARVCRRMVEPLHGLPIVVLVGPGNNGGDGLVTARHLQRWGGRVTAYLCRDRPAADPKLAADEEAGVAIVRVSDDPGYARLDALLESAHLVVDAVLGTGRARPIEGGIRDILGRLSDARRRSHPPKLLAMDLPTGLNCDIGEVDPACVAVDVTVSLGYPKRGHLGFPGADFIGELQVVDIGIPAGLDDDIELELIMREWAGSALPNRPSDSHKGSFGRTMVVAGSPSFLGAPYLASMAAARVGAGLVTIAIPESLVASIAPVAVEPTFLPLPESAPGVPATGAAEMIHESLDEYSALLVGCGLGQAHGTRAMVEELLLSGHELPPTVVDADGLNTLAQCSDWFNRWPEDAVLTPHPGEMVRLTGESSEGLRANRIEVSTAAAVEWAKTVVLKGAFTVVAHPDGTAMISPYANPGLATAGTGDVLAGAIAGLMSQGVASEGAAALGVFLHGEAGESVRREIGDTGMIASDLLPALPGVIRNLRSA